MKYISGKKLVRVLLAICGTILFLRRLRSPPLKMHRDAGITISCHMNDLLARVGRESSQLLPKPQRALKVLELGTGCGMVD